MDAYCRHLSAVRTFCHLYLLFPFDLFLFSCLTSRRNAVTHVDRSAQSIACHPHRCKAVFLGPHRCAVTKGMPTSGTEAGCFFGSSDSRVCNTVDVNVPVSGLLLLATSFIRSFIFRLTSNVCNFIFRALSSSAIAVKLYISTDNGVTWFDADTSPGPLTSEGMPVLLKYVVNNTGNVPLKNVTLSKHLLSNSFTAQ